MAKRPAIFEGVITEISSEDPKDSGVRKKYLKITLPGDNQICVEFRGEYLLSVLENFSIHDPVEIRAFANVIKYNQYFIGHTIKINSKALVTQ